MHAAAAQDPEFIKKVLDSYQADLKADGEAAAAFCKSPAFKGASCEHNGIVSASEAKATITRQCPLCGTLYTPLVDVKKLPATISGVDRYNQYHTGRVLSWACTRCLSRSGPVTAPTQHCMQLNCAWLRVSRCVLACCPHRCGEPLVRRPRRGARCLQAADADRAQQPGVA